MYNVLDSPMDKIVFDVSHQCYTHKLLTGRKTSYLVPEWYANVTVFINPAENEHDIFAIGHTSIAISLGLRIGEGSGSEEGIL